eukprot:UN20336
MWKSTNRTKIFKLWRWTWLKDEFGRVDAERVIFNNTTSFNTPAVDSRKYYFVVIISFDPTTKK